MPKNPINFYTSNLWVKNNLNILDCNVISLPKNIYVGNQLNLADSIFNDTDLKSNITGPKIILDNSNIETISGKLNCKELYVSESHLKSISSEIFLNKHLDALYLNNSNIELIDFKDFSIGILFLNNPQKKIEIKHKFKLDDLRIQFFKHNDFPKNLIPQNLQIYNTNLKEFPVELNKFKSLLLNTFEFSFGEILEVDVAKLKISKINK